MDPFFFNYDLTESVHLPQEAGPSTKGKIKYFSIGLPKRTTALSFILTIRLWRENVAHKIIYMKY